MSVSDQPTSKQYTVSVWVHHEKRNIETYMMMCECQEMLLWESSTIPSLRSIDWLKFTLWFPLSQTPCSLAALAGNCCSSLILSVVVSVPSKPWPEPEPGRLLRITTESWAATPAPARSRLWPSTGSGSRRVTPTRWGKRRTSRCAFLVRSLSETSNCYYFFSSRYKKLKKLCWIGQKELYTTSGRARVLTFPSNSL